MNPELKILESADHAELLEYGDCSCRLIVNKKLEYPCMFGFAALSDSFDNVKGLFTLAEQRARELGYTKLIGPLNFNTWMSYRWALDRYDLNYFPDCLNEPYYVDYIRQLGYRELYTYRSAKIKIKNDLYLVSKAVYLKKQAEGYSFRFFSGDEVYSVSREIFDICLNAFEGSLLYSEITYEQFDDIYLSRMRKIEGIAMYVAYFGNKPVGFVMGYVNPFNRGEFISKTSAVIKAHRKNKLYVALLHLGCRYVKKLGFDSIVYHFQCEQRSTFQRFDKTVESDEKRYAVFIKEL